MKPCKAPDSMIFHVSRNLRDEPLPQLMAALAGGETLSLNLLAAEGHARVSAPLLFALFSNALAFERHLLAQEERGRDYFLSTAKRKFGKPA